MLTPNELERYSRQINQHNIGIAGQETLKRAKILCVGIGGLGAPVCLYLASCGVGTIGLVDGDQVALSNLHRQILFCETDLGLNKAKAAAKKLNEINPHCQIILYDKHIDENSILAIIADYDLILDCSDNFSTRYLINDACAELHKPYVYASVLNFSGQLALFDQKQGACLRCLYPEPPLAYIPNCAEAGILGVVPGIIATQQALLAMKYFLTLETDFNYILNFDFLNNTMNKIIVRKSPSCAICAENKNFFQLPRYPRFCEDKLLRYALSANKFLMHLKSNNNYLLIDVREPYEFQRNRLNNAINIPVNDIRSFESLDKSQLIYLYCQSGKRSIHACELLLQNGYQNIYYLNENLNNILN